MLHQKLYKLNTDGSTIQEWSMETNGAKYRTICGQLNGKKVTSEWTLCEGKNIGKANETTAAQQALKEVEACYVLKRKKGYRNTPKEAQTADVFKPMLAHKFDDRFEEVEQAFKQGRAVYSQVKLDGIRCIAKANGLWSRTGNPIVACPHIHEALKKIFEQEPDLILDGELYSHDYHDDFNKIVSLVKKTKITEKETEATRKHIQYWVYDAAIEGTFSKRIEKVAAIIKKIGAPLILVPTTKVKSMEHLDQLYEEYLEKNFEGQIIRQDAEYENKRTKNLLKRKTFDDAEFEVVRIEEGVGNSSGTARICYLKLDTRPDEIFKADITGTHEERQEILRKAKSLVGKMASVKFFSKRTPDGVPRFGKVIAFHETERW